MKKLLLVLVAIGLMAGFSNKVVAQVTGTDAQVLTLGVPEIALIEGDAVTMNALTTGTPGALVASEAVIGYVQVSSIVVGTELRTITAVIDAVPAGTTIKVTTALPTLNMGGTVGTGSSIQELVAAGSKTIATGIGSCYTGVGETDGYQLSYLWEPKTGVDYADIKYQTGTVANVTLTLTAGVTP